MTRQEAVQFVIEQLGTTYDTDPAVTMRAAQQMVQTITHGSFESLVIDAHKELTPQEMRHLHTAITQIRDEQMPLAYLVGQVPFVDNNIKVRAPILIPRPETEEWVAHLIDTLKKTPSATPSTILDLCTGSGCIALALAKAFPHAQVTGIDINPAAIQLAQENAMENKIFNARFLKSDLFSVLNNNSYDLIVSNPPYIPETARNKIDVSVLNWEDERALFSGQDGLDLLTQIIKLAPQHLSRSRRFPALVVEIDRTQKDVIMQKCHAAGFTHVTCMTDFNGNPRTIWAGYNE